MDRGSRDSSIRPIPGMGHGVVLRRDLDQNTQIFGIIELVIVSQNSVPNWYPSQCILYCNGTKNSKVMLDHGWLQCGGSTRDRPRWTYLNSDIKPNLYSCIAYNATMSRAFLTIKTNRRIMQKEQMSLYYSY